MPTCLECNTTLPRLQWTHFRYKCTGRFKNGTEYRQHYKGAKLVDDDICSRTAVTLENLIKKYGKDEGESRWSDYREKQAISNTFQYKNEKYGWDEKQFMEFNKSRAVTLENMISKHGETVGTIKYNEYVDIQRHTCSIEYFIDAYGYNDGTEKYNNFAKNRAVSTHINSVYINGRKASKLELSVYEKIVEVCPDIEHQFMIPMQTVGGSFDFGSMKDKKIVEVYGYFWHCDPRFCDENYIHPVTKKAASEIRERDAKKRSHANDMGYEVFVIWELDWMNDPDSVINLLKSWWNDENECRNASNID